MKLRTGQYLFTGIRDREICKFQTFTLTGSPIISSVEHTEYFTFLKRKLIFTEVQKSQGSSLADGSRFDKVHKYEPVARSNCITLLVSLLNRVPSVPYVPACLHALRA